MFAYFRERMVTVTNIPPYMRFGISDYHGAKRSELKDPDRNSDF